MKKMLVCFKTVPDLDMLSENDWPVEKSQHVTTKYVRKIINPYDECSLELSLRYRDALAKSGDQVSLTALTIDNDSSSRTAKLLYALGFERVIRITSSEDDRFDSFNIAEKINHFMKIEGPYDFIVLGIQSSVGDNSQVPFLLCEMAGMPCVQNVKSIYPSSSGIEIVSQQDYLELIQIINPPVVLAIGNVAKSYLRVPTLKEKLAVKNKDYELYDESDLTFAKDCNKKQTLIALQPRNSKRMCNIIEGPNAKEKAKKLFHDFLKEKVNP
ncbi:MAG: hypothetical protein JXI43_07060 [Tissierellales bacterium]|nr:hypothetical protein [Tissierellales bacterium]